MAIKEVKAGEKYKLELLCIHNSGKVIIFETPTGDHLPFRESDLECVSPAKQDVLPEHSTVGTLSPAERLDRLWNGMWDVLFGEASLRYAADDFNKAMRNHIKSMNPDTANGTKNTETATKYDPNREFRKGDKVKAVLRHGRIPNDGVPKDVILEVIADERDGVVKVLHKMGAILEIFNVYALYLELITPIEELEPYFVEHYKHSNAYKIRKGGQEFAIFWDTHPNAKAAAEAERDRLNAEYRKEQNNV